MYRTISRLVVPAVILAFGATTVSAQNGGSIRSVPEKGQISFTPYAGTDFTIYGDFVESAGMTATIVAPIAGTFAAAVDDQDFSDVYGQSLTVGLDGNYGVSDSGEVFVTARYTTAQGDKFRAVDFSPDRVPLIGIPGFTGLDAKLDDYHEVGGSVGYRQFFATNSPFTPYISGSAGIKYIHEINVDLNATNAGLFGAAPGLPALGLDDMDFYGSTITYDVGLDIGFRYDVLPNVALGIETGLHFSGDLDSDDTSLAFIDSLLDGGATSLVPDVGQTGSFTGANNGGARLTIPLMAKLTVTTN
jgi:hypothetical protein